MVRQWLRQWHCYKLDLIISEFGNSTLLLPLPHRIGSEPIYLWCCCHCCTSMSKSICYNVTVWGYGTYLLLKKRRRIDLSSGKSLIHCCNDSYSSIPKMLFNEDKRLRRSFIIIRRDCHFYKDRRELKETHHFSKE